jgi:hypothetical protein
MKPSLEPFALGAGTSIATGAGSGHRLTDGYRHPNRDTVIRG